MTLEIILRDIYKILNYYIIMKRLIVLLLVVFLVGCSTEYTVEDIIDEPVENGTVDEDVIEIEVGESFSFELDSNPTTGYGWVIEHDWEILEMESGYASDCVDDEMVGCGGVSTYTFTGIGEGETVLSLSYCRSWDCENSMSQEIVYDVVVA